MNTPPAPPVSPLLLPLNTAARMLGVSRSHLYRLHARNELVLRRLGGRTLACAASVKRLAETAPELPQPKSAA